MIKEIDWEKVKKLLDDLYRSSEALKEIFTGRSFALDGHLVGSIGEVVVAYMINLRLNNASTMAHDALTTDAKKVEIKFTQGKLISIRHEPDFLIAMQSLKTGSLKVVYNGPAAPVWNAAGKMQKNGARPIVVTKLCHLNSAVRDRDRIEQLRNSPI